MQGIGIDFGTTNSVIAFADDDGNVRTMSWPSDGDAGVYRTALAFRVATSDGMRSTITAAGPRAIEWALNPASQQRFLQSIKTHLGSAAFRESRVFGERYTLEDLIARFIRHMIDEGSGIDLNARVAAGRPVVFAGDRADETLALSRLEKAYAQAGIEQANFVYEPLGAAYWYARNLTKPQTVLVADFGGGTSDFSVMRFDRKGGRLQAGALAHDGVGIAGDTFDYRIIDHVVSPRLGKNAHYRSLSKTLPVPRYFFAAFSRWHQLSWLKDPKVLSDLEDIIETADDRHGLESLRTVIDHDLGLDLYAAITATKTALSSTETAEFNFEHYGVSLKARIHRKDFENWIADDLSEIRQAMERTVSKAGIKDTDIDAVFLTGGTSYVPAVKALFTTRFGPDRIHLGNAFQSVASGLALAARDQA